MSVAALVLCSLATMLYALGGRGKRRRLRATAYYVGIASALVVLEPPFDGWADTSFALHMTQHVVLMTVSAPLIVLGPPWRRLWVPFPLRARRAVAHALAGSPAVRVLGAVRRPAVSLAL